jgi:hypothetical protein
VAIILVALVIGAVGYVPVNDSSSSSITTSAPSANLLTNGGFETGNLQGWQSIPPYIPTVESAVVENGSSYAARFQTSTNEGNASSPCLIQGIGCGALNTSTIYQNVPDVSVSNGTMFSLAVDPIFQYPSGFQISLEFSGPAPPAPSSSTAVVSTAVVSTATSTVSTSTQGPSLDVIVFYLVLASSQQCSTYSRDLVDAKPGAMVAVHCLSAPQGSWTLVTRDLATDLPAGVSPSDLTGSTLTLSISFAGADSGDTVYVDSFSVSH